MALQERTKKSEGVTFLFYGESATGKTPAALSFPNQLLFDSDGGTKFYDEYNDNILMESNTLIFKEMNDDLDEFENNEDLFNSVETINVDSVTRYYENMQHAALKIAEQRAMKAGRATEGEGISVKERGVMKLNYDRFFARMLMYSKLAKNIVFVAEQTDLNENRTDAQGNQVSVKVGVKPNMQKDSKFDFDVVVNTYTKDGKSYGKVEKDRTKTFKVGEVVEMPNYKHWEEAIIKSRTGKKFTKADIKNYEDALQAEAEDLKNTTLNDADVIKNEIGKIIAKLSTEKQKELHSAFTKQVGDVKYKVTDDIVKLNKYLEVAKSIK